MEREELLKPDSCYSKHANRLSLIRESCLARSFFLIRRIDSAARSSNLGDFPTRLIGSILHANYKSLDGGRQPDAARGVSPTANDCRLSFNPNSGANAEREEEREPLSSSPIICHTLSLSVRSRTMMILRFLDIKPLVASRKKPTRALPKLRRVPNLSSPSIHRANDLGWRQCLSTEGGRRQAARSSWRICPPSFAPNLS